MRNERKLASGVGDRCGGFKRIWTHRRICLGGAGVHLDVIRRDGTDINKTECAERPPEVIE
jgi:hypothetical protein